MTEVGSGPWVVVGQEWEEPVEENGTLRQYVGRSDPYTTLGTWCPLPTRRMSGTPGTDTPFQSRPPTPHIRVLLGTEEESEPRGETTTQKGVDRPGVTGVWNGGPNRVLKG